MTRKRTYGTGALYEKHGCWYGRWRTSNERRLNRRIGPVRIPHTDRGLTRRDAERLFRRMQEDEERNPTPVAAVRHTVDDACVAHRKKLAYIGVSKSYMANCERKQRLYIGPAMGTMRLEKGRPPRRRVTWRVDDR